MFLKILDRFPRPSLARLKARAARIDRTPYDGWAARARPGKQPFVLYWMQRLPAVVVRGDLRRVLNAITRVRGVRFT